MRQLLLAVAAAALPGAAAAQIAPLGMSGWVGLGELNAVRQWTASPKATASAAASPSASFVLPVDQAAVSGAIFVLAAAGASPKAARVEFYLDGALAATIAAPPYLFAWDTTSAANGAHTLTAVAYAAGGASGRASVQVAVQNRAGGPLWWMTLPISSGAVVFGDLAAVPVQVRLASAGARGGALTIGAEDVSNPLVESLKRRDEIGRGLVRLSAGAQVGVSAPAAVQSTAGGSAAQPAIVTLPYDPSKQPTGAGPAAYAWNAPASSWQALPTLSVDATNGTITASASLGASSAYAVYAAAAPRSTTSATLGEVFAFPNPVRRGKATIHVESSGADEIKLRFYDLAGSLVHTATLSGAPSTGVNGTLAYEYAWDASGVASGAYFYTVEARAAGQTSHASGKLAVTR